MARAAKFVDDPELIYAENKGFHRVDSRARVLSFLAEGTVGAELGVFAGKFSEFILSKVRPREFHMVDVWEKAYHPNYPNWGPYTAEGRLKVAVAKGAATERGMQFSKVCNVQVHEEYSTAWLDTLADEYLDWAYVDSSHTYEGTLEELRKLKSKIKPGGIICGDDFWIDQNSPHYGVFRAVQQFCQDTDFRILYADDAAQWVIQERGA